MMSGLHWKADFSKAATHLVISGTREPSSPPSAHAGPQSLEKHSGLLRGAFCCVISPKKIIDTPCLNHQLHYKLFKLLYIWFLYIYMPLDIEKLLEASHIGKRPSKNRKRRRYRLIKAWNTNLGNAQNDLSQTRDSFLRRSSRIIGEAAGLLQPPPSSPEPIYIPFPGYQTQVIRKRAKMPPRSKTTIPSKSQSSRNG